MLKPKMIDVENTESSKSRDLSVGNSKRITYSLFSCMFLFFSYTNTLSVGADSVIISIKPHKDDLLRDKFSLSYFFFLLKVEIVIFV